MRYLFEKLEYECYLYTNNDYVVITWEGAVKQDERHFETLEDALFFILGQVAYFARNSTHFRKPC